MRFRHLMGAALAALAIGGPVRAAGQSVSKRSPNLLGGWVAPKGVIQLNFLHRFTLSDAPLRKITNTPTFNVGTGVTDHLMVGFVYGSNSTLVPAYPNEWELYARALPLSEDGGAPLDVSVQAGYNVASESVDGELFLGRTLGRLRLLLAGRAFSQAFDSTATRFAVTGGAVLRLTPSISVAGDYGALIDRTAGERAAWGAGIQLGVPYTPHSFSIQATNVGTASLEGVSTGGRTRWGFEYTIPITIRRYIPAHPDGEDAQGAQAAPAATHRNGGTHGPAVNGVRVRTAPEALLAGFVRPSMDTVYVDIKNLAYAKGNLKVAVGTTVVWRNLDPIQHSVIASDGSFSSGLIDPKKSFAVTFEDAGVHAYHCKPHPFMTGRVTVQAATPDHDDGGGAREEDR